MQNEDTEDMQKSLPNIMINKAAQQGDTMDNDDQCNGQLERVAQDHKISGINKN